MNRNEIDHQQAQQRHAYANASGRLEDTSACQFDMPESLQEVLDSDPDAAAVFAELTPGNQRGLIYLVSKVKSIDIQIQKALTIAEGMKMGITSPREIAKLKRN